MRLLRKRINRCVTSWFIESLPKRLHSIGAIPPISVCVSRFHAAIRSRSLTRCTTLSKVSTIAE